VGKECKFVFTLFECFFMDSVNQLDFEHIKVVLFFFCPECFIKSL
jgi:hypothetical protein